MFSALLYTVVTWILKNKNEDQLLAFEMQCYHNFLEFVNDLLLTSFTKENYMFKRVYQMPVLQMFCLEQLKNQDSAEDRDTT